MMGDNGLGGIPISGGHSDLGAIRASLKALSDGQVLGIFPQGTRSRDNTPTPMLNGVSMIAQRAQVPEYGESYLPELPRVESIRDVAACEALMRAGDRTARLREFGARGGRKG